MDLLQQIQDTAIQADTDVAVLLRQCKVLAARLGNQEFKQWVDYELDGYPSTDVLPSYRILGVQSLGHFVGPFQSEMRNVPLPPSNLPEAHRHLATHAYLVESISVYSALTENATGSLQIDWPADAVLAFGDRFAQNMTLLRAWRVLSRAAVRGIIETVKNRILSLALDLAAEPLDTNHASAAAEVGVEQRVGQLFDRQIRRARRVFVGHGRSNLWKDLQHFITSRLRLECEEFNSEPAAGLSTKERLKQMLDASAFAFLVMTGEDEVNGALRARENVVHEIGLFQGRLGFEKAIILLEDGCSPFSNINGLTHIPFGKGHVDSASEEIRRVLEREGLLPK